MSNLKSLVIASHRGGKGPFRENTPAAFLHSIQQGADAVEMDIRYDYLRGRFFLAHDFFHRPHWKRNLLQDCIKQVPADVLNIIELKTLSFASYFFARKFVKFYKENLEGRKVVVISFNPFVLMRLRKLHKKMGLGFICGDMFSHFVFEKFLYRHIRPAVYVVSKRLLNHKTVTMSKSKGMQIYTYLINSANMWQKALQFEVDGIITDVPLKFVKQLTK